MKLRIRNSARKRSKMVGFRTRMKTRGGRAIIRRRRRIGKKLSPKN
ncbi:MAG: 50S ribosomal protein L34 [Planctomycetota bacterium]